MSMTVIYRQWCTISKMARCEGCQNIEYPIGLCVEWPRKCYIVTWHEIGLYNLKEYVYVRTDDNRAENTHYQLIRRKSDTSRFDRKEYPPFLK